MSQEEIYELLHQVLEPFNRGLDIDRKTALDGLLDAASRKLAAQIAQGLPAWQAWLDAEMSCGHVQRYRTGPEGMTDEQWIKAECDECVACEIAKLNAQ